MESSSDQPAAHEHTEVKTIVVLQRAGVPYEVERTFCFSCRQVLSERPVRRTAA